METKWQHFVVIRRIKILFHNVYKETLLIFRSKILNIGKVFSFLFFYFSFSQKSPIYWTYVFSFLIPYYYPFCQISFFLFKIFMNSPLVLLLLFSAYLFTLSPYNLSIKISVPTPYPRRCRHVCV